VRFSRQIQQATEAVLPDFKPAALRPRFTFAETMSAEETVAIIDRIQRRGSQGLCLKARNTGKTRQAVRKLAEKGIPVVTVFTDIPDIDRLAYVGLNNERAGRTAAYLMLKLLKDDDRTILTTLSQHSFQGEEERFRAFRSELMTVRPELELVDASGGGGLSPATALEVRDKLHGIRAVAGVYSMGGGNLAILRALQAVGIEPGAFIAHDLDEDNLELLRGEKLSLVLYHDLRADMRLALRYLLAFHGIGEPPRSSESDIHVVTPLNIPRDP